MCNQTVGLIAAEMERRGIVTVCIQFLRDVAEKVRPPRSLVVPFKHGYPLGRPSDPELQRGILEKALAMASDQQVVPPALAQWEVSQT